jgi:hypothetical protein
LDYYESIGILSYKYKRPSKYLPYSKNFKFIKENMSNILVLPGSQRISIAFEMTFENSKIIDNKVWMELMHTKKKIKDKKKKLIDYLQISRNLNSDITNDFQFVAKEVQNFKIVFGQQNFETFQKEIYDKKINISNRITRLDSQLAELEFIDNKLDGFEN